MINRCCHVQVVVHIHEKHYGLLNHQTFTSALQFISVVKIKSEKYLNMREGADSTDYGKAPCNKNYVLRTGCKTGYHSSYESGLPYTP